MPLLSATDLDKMLAAMGTEDFTHADGSVDGRTITGIFDEHSTQTGMFTDGPGVMTTAPKLTVSVADALGIDRGDRLTRGVNGREYYLIQAEPDGSGLVGLILSEDEGE
jgi:hypothetical protein